MVVIASRDCVRRRGQVSDATRRSAGERTDEQQSDTGTEPAARSHPIPKPRPTVTTAIDVAMLARMMMLSRRFREVSRSSQETTLNCRRRLFEIDEVRVLTIEDRAARVRSRPREPCAPKAGSVSDELPGYVNRPFAHRRSPHSPRPTAGAVRA